MEVAKKRETFTGSEKGLTGRKIRDRKVRETAALALRGVFFHPRRNGNVP